jgi:hypothetical protein
MMIEESKKVIQQNQSVTYLVDDIRTESLLQYWGFITVVMPMESSLLTMFVDEKEPLDILSRQELNITDCLKQCENEWIIILPNNLMKSVKKAFYFEQRLRTSSLANVIRMYPFSTRIWNDGQDLPSVFQEEDLDQLKMYSRQRILGNHGKPMYWIHLPAISIDVSKPLDKGQYFVLEKYLESCYMSILSQSWVSYKYITQVWLSEQYFRSAIFSEIALIIMSMNSSRSLKIGLNPLDMMITI